VSVVLKPKAVRARLLKLEEVISRLEELHAAGVNQDFRDIWAVERGLQLAAEVVFDIGNHVLSAHFGVGAEDYEDILDQLSRQDVISDALRERLKGLGGFCNILVHDYLRLDPEVVTDKLASSPVDFSEFVRAVRLWMDENL
jgi:uncharacterized protein YutE (UPF0331/DUF86 family)